MKEIWFYIFPALSLSNLWPSMLTFAIFALKLGLSLHSHSNTPPLSGIRAIFTSVRDYVVNIISAHLERYDFLVSFIFFLPTSDNVSPLFIPTLLYPLRPCSWNPPLIWRVHRYLFGLARAIATAVTFFLFEVNEHEQIMRRWFFIFSCSAVKLYLFFALLYLSSFSPFICIPIPSLVAFETHFLVLCDFHIAILSSLSCTKEKNTDRDPREKATSGALPPTPNVSFMRKRVFSAN